MSIRSRSVALAVVAMLAVVPSTAAAQITVNPPAMGNHVNSVPVTGCGANVMAPSVTLNPDPSPRIAAAAANGMLDNTFTADLAEYPGWTLAFGGSLAGTLAIDFYQALNFGICEGGARMWATYTPAAGEPAGITFTNLFRSNTVGGGGGTHIDPFPNNDTAPMYYTAAARGQFGLQFRDRPFDACRPANNNGSVTTQFQTYLSTFDAQTRVLTAYDGWSWGYTVTCQPLVVGNVPEPSTTALLALGLVVLVVLPVRRRLYVAVDRGADAASSAGG